MCIWRVELLLAAQERYDSQPEYKPPVKRKIRLYVTLLAEKHDTDRDIRLGPYDLEDSSLVLAVNALIARDVLRRQLNIEEPREGYLSMALGRYVSPTASLSSLSFAENVSLSL